VNSAHLEYETLADLAEGLLDDALAASAAEHLADCGLCRERSAELTEVSRLLAESPVPPMPEALAARIDAAVAAESMATATVASMRARRDRRGLRILSAAAAAIVVVGGGAMVTRAVTDSASTSASNPPHGAPVPFQDHRKTSADSSRATPRMAPNSAPQVRAAGYPVAATGTDYRESTLGAQITATLGRAGGTTRDAAQPLAGCVDRIAAGRRPLLVDNARFEHTPATVIAFAGADARRLDVSIVGSGCSAGDPGLIKHLQTTR
jgi:hypothetical protein